MGLTRLIAALLAPALVIWAVVVTAFGRETLRDLRERLGLAPLPQAQSPTLWIHAASNGELASAEEVIHALLRADPEMRLLITTNSTSGRALAQRWDLPQTMAILAPFDWRWATRRLLCGYGVIGLVILESELWPNRITTAAEDGAPVCIIGARLSRKSARAWRRALWVARPMLDHVTWLLPQDRGSQRRFARLGMREDRIGPVTDLKALYATEGKPLPDPAILTTYAPAQTWLAASTHPGEDEIVLDAHLAARVYWPELELILAPRHPRRAEDIRKLAEARGLMVAQRSRGEPAVAGHVYLADSLGEMPRFYANAETCLVAGSLVDNGGHTPFEPAAFRCALLHGPFLRNFLAAYRRLDVAGGAIQVRDAESLAMALVELRDPARRRALVDNAARVLGPALGPDPIAETLLTQVGRAPSPPVNASRA